MRVDLGASHRVDGIKTCPKWDYLVGCVECLVQGACGLLNGENTFEILNEINMNIVFNESLCANIN